MEITLVSAARFEAEAFLRAATTPNLTINYLSCGIGALHAAKEESRLARLCRGKQVLFIGTCGSFAPFHGVELVQIDQVHWLPTCERAGYADSIAGLHPPIVLPEAPAWLDLPIRTALCGPTISRYDLISAKLQAGLAAKDLLVENLELYSCIGAIAHSCQSLAVVLAITNEISDLGRSQWREHYLEAAEKTAAYLVTTLCSSLGS